MESDHHFSRNLTGDRIEVLPVQILSSSTVTDLSKNAKYINSVLAQIRDHQTTGRELFRLVHFNVSEKNRTRSRGTKDSSALKGLMTLLRLYSMIWGMIGLRIPLASGTTARLVPRISIRTLKPTSSGSIYMWNVTAHSHGSRRDFPAWYL